MDPAATIKTIQTTQDHEEFARAFVSLWNWVLNGGFLPKYESDGRNRIGTTSLHVQWCGGYFAIQTVDPNSEREGWELVKYDVEGNTVTRKVFPC